MFGIERVKAVKLGSGIPGVELPVDGGSGGVAFLDQGLDFPPQRVLVGEPLPQAGAGQHAENELKPWRKQQWCIPKVSAEFVAHMEDVPAAGGLLR